MNAIEIAMALLSICSFCHPDGRLYMDDALDTWACLYAEESSWDDVERALIELKGEHYWEGGHLDRLRSMEHASLYLWHILEDAEWLYGHLGEDMTRKAVDAICSTIMELAMNG